MPEHDNLDHNHDVYVNHYNIYNDNKHFHVEHNDDDLRPLRSGLG